MSSVCVQPSSTPHTRSFSFSSKTQKCKGKSSSPSRSTSITRSFINRYIRRRRDQKDEQQPHVETEEISEDKATDKATVQEDEKQEIVVLSSTRSAPENPIGQQTSYRSKRVLSTGAISGSIFLQDRRPRRRRVTRRRPYTSHYRPRKIVVVGDMHCGKSCLVASYCADKFIDVYTPTILKCMRADCKIQGRLIDIIVADTPGRYDYLPLRQVAYDKCDLVIICFSLDSPETLDNVKSFWVPEVLKNAPGKPFMVVGNRRDYRDEVYANWCCCEICQHCHLGCQKGLNTLKRMDADELLKSTMLSYDQGCLMAKELGAVAYQECSAKFRDNTRTVFECATEMAMKKHRRKRRHKTREPHEACIIL